MVVDEFTLRLGLSVATLGVHDRSILVHDGVPLSGRVGPFEARVTGNGVTLREESKELVSRRVPFDGQLLKVNDLVSMHDFFD